MTPRSSFKQSFLAFCCLLAFSASSFAAGQTGIDGKLLQAFKQTFPNAEQVKWIEQANRYSVNFKEGNVVTKIDYDKEGNFVSSVRYYSEKNLPVNILCKLLKKYGDKKIFGVTEMTTDATVEYYIKLEDDKNWITVKSGTDGGMRVVEKYRKSA